ncbi:MAG TPA: FkbM family methyltransferase, partial [Blastocatellia bacterium]|nr:FkbM family methyltransferase [Blastocatellia bacterium]
MINPVLFRFYKSLTRIRPSIVGAWIKSVAHIKRREVQTPLGVFSVDPASCFGLMLIEKGVYEPEMVRVLQTCLKEGAVFFDVGANEGYHSVIASKIVGPKGRVFAIEPQSRLQPALQKNLELNRCANVTLIKSAISDQEGQAVLFLLPDINNGASGLIRGTKYAVPTETIDTVTLEKLFTTYSIDVCDLMKMDIEGFEPEAIFGSASLFEARRIRALALEPSAGLARQ